MLNPLLTSLGGAFVCLMVAPAVLMYGVAPLIVRRNRTMARDVHHVGTRIEDLSPLAATGIRDVVNALAVEGFDVIGNFAAAGMTEGMRSVQVLLINEAQGCWANAFYVGAAGTNPLVKETWTVVFRTRDEDGQEIVTASARPTSIYPRRRRAVSINSFWVKEPRTLFRIHQAHVAKESATGRRRILPPREDANGFLAREHVDEMERVVAAGYYRFDPAAGRYRMSVRGAYVMTWRLLWPLKGIRRRRQVRATVRTLRRLGFAEIAAACPAL